MSETSDQPVAEEPIAGSEETGVADEAQAQGEGDPQLDEDGNPIEGDAEDDSEEIEFEGQKHKLPKALAKEFAEGTLRQADYTRKTQEVATQRQELTARATEMAQQAEAQSATLEERATLKAVEAQLSTYQGTDWAAYSAQHGSEATNIAMIQWRQLEAAQATLQGEITRKETEHRSQREQTTANALREADQQLSREVKGYGPEFVKAVTETASTLGFTPLELRDSLIGADGKPDVRAFKVLAELSELRQFKAKHEAAQTKAKTAQRQAAVEPAKTVRGNASSFKPGLNDELPQDEWLRRRNAQVAKANGR